MPKAYLYKRFMRVAVANVAGVLLGVVLAITSPGTAAAQGGGPKFEMTKVADNVYSFRFIIHRNMVVITDEGVIISDPLNPAAAGIMMAEIKKLTDQPVKYVIYSHNHWDHISGGKVFADQGAKIIQHELAAKATRPHPAVVKATETWSGERHKITLGGQTVELIYVGESHGAGMTVMRLPNHKILHTVDIVTPGRVAFTIMPDFVPFKWALALKKVEQLDFERIIPGHGPAQAPRSAVAAQREYIEDLSQAILNAVKVTKNPFALKKITELVKAELRPKYGKWNMFDQWMGMNVLRVTLEQRIGW